jgi:hypothetical protein
LAPGVAVGVREIGLSSLVRIAGTVNATGTAPSASAIAAVSAVMPDLLMLLIYYSDG